MSREEARDASLACCRLGSVKETELLIGGPQTVSPHLSLITNMNVSESEL